MNKLNRAIAYLVSKVRTAYHATRFFLSVITLEFPNERIDGRVTEETLRLRDLGLESNTPDTLRGLPTGGSPSPLSTPDYSCCGLFDFLDGDFMDGFGHPSSEDSSGATKSTCNGLQDRQVIEEWDLLKPCDRQAIILDAMRSRQAESDDYELFSVDSVIKLCDYSSMSWFSVFDDLIELRNQSKVVVRAAYDERGIKFYGLLWGLK